MHTCTYGKYETENYCSHVIYTTQDNTMEYDGTHATAWDLLDSWTVFYY